METFYKIMSDDIKVVIHRWSPKKVPRAVIQIVHGMAEHSLRYARFAEEACNNGYEVWACDQRGHGETVARAEEANTSACRGCLADEDGFCRAVEDQYEINAEIRAEFRNVPVIILGHSFGSFVTQRYIEKYGSSVQACILSGSAGPNWVTPLGGLIAKQAVVFCGKRKPSKFMNFLSFGAYNKAFAPTKTDFDWLSRDEDEVARYIADKDCGFICSAGFFNDLMYGLNTIHKKENIATIPKDLPILIASGTCDPVSSCGKTVKKLYEIYQEIGLKNVELKLYDGARHEILNEVNREEVKADFFSWIEKSVV